MFLRFLRGCVARLQSKLAHGGLLLLHISCICKRQCITATIGHNELYLVARVNGQYWSRLGKAPRNFKVGYLWVVLRLLFLNLSRLEKTKTKNDGVW